MLDELRQFAVYEKLNAIATDYLSALNPQDLYGRILTRWEEDSGISLVWQALRLIWAARDGLDMFEIAARQALARNPLDFERIQAEDPTIVHLVIVGFGAMGQHLTLQALKIGHFANLQQLRITVLERSGSPRPDAFLKQHPRVMDKRRASAWQQAGLVSVGSTGRTLQGIKPEGGG